MINKVYEVLKPLNLPIKWLKRPPFDKSNIAISYHFFNESGELFGEGKATEEGGSLQVDVFGKTDYSSIVKDVKKLLKSARFLFAEAYPDTEEALDQNTTVYHKVLIFNYLESEVMMNVE